MATSKPIEKTPVRPVFDEPATPDTTTEASAEPAPERFSGPWVRKFWREQIRPLAIMLIALFSVRSSLADWNVVPTGSMKPTIIEGDRIFVNKLAYDLKFPFTTWHLIQWSNPKRGEIVVFDSPKDGTRLVKRVIGVPGDTIQLIDEHLYVNGEPASYGPLDKDTEDQVDQAEKRAHQPKFFTETFANVTHAVMQLTVINQMFINHSSFPATFPVVVVPQGQYFMMGDNRDNSADSRYIGFVPRGNIVGRSSRVIISLNYDNYYLPRSDRFFRALP